MITLDEHNRMKRDTNIAQSRSNGIACPKCGCELVDTDPSNVLTSYPPQIEVHCEDCRFSDYRVV